jgi:hypothetical protein
MTLDLSIDTHNRDPQPYPADLSIHRATRSNMSLEPRTTSSTPRRLGGPTVASWCRWL